jgi:hypothetical protein
VFIVSTDETKQLQLPGEIFNLVNRSNFYNPISAISLDGVTANPQFGKVQSGHDRVRSSWRSASSFSGGSRL